MVDRALVRRDRLVMEATAVLFVVAIATIAHRSGWHYLLFPALAALSHDVLTRPWGRWASQPGRLVATPTIGAAVGTSVARDLPYRVAGVVLVVTLCLLLLALLRSNIAPTIAAGMLPIVLNTKSWSYPVAVLVGLAALVTILLPWRIRCRQKYHATGVAMNNVDDIFETRATGNKWALPFFAFLTLMAACAAVSGFRLILFPPLFVIAYEMFAHPTSCPWAGKPVALPVACVLASIGGWSAVGMFGTSGIAAGCGMVFGIIVLRLLEIRMPPALAIGILPLIIAAPGIQYPVSVGIGTTALTLTFLLYRRFVVSSAVLDKSSR